VAELDWVCRASAFTEAIRGGLGPPLTLFVNAEPVSLGVSCPDDLKAAIEQAKGRLRVVVEVTERALAGTRPGCWPPSPRPARTAGGWPWTTSARPRPPWPSCRSSAPT
jgi:hypothetical protein